MRLIRSTLALVLAGTAFVAGAASDEEMAVAYRQSVFKVIYWNFGQMGAMVRGAKDFDAKDFAMRATRVAAMADQIAEGFPAGSAGKGVTEARPEVWEHWSDFEAKLGDFRRESASLRDVAATGDEDATRAQFAKVRQTCGACHDDFKED